MEAWAVFWGWFLLVSLFVFAVVTVVVGIGGFADVRELFRSIETQHARQSGEDEESDIT